MATKKNTPFFSELGKLFNLIRNISAELTEETKIDGSNKTAFHDIMYARDAAIARLRTNLQQLESDIAYFFTDNGSRKTIENRFDTQMLRKKFNEAFKALTNEYLDIKSDYSGKNTFQRNTNKGVNSEIYKLKTLPFSLMN